MFPLTALLNHSCANNIQRKTVQTQQGKKDIIEFVVNFLKIKGNILPSIDIPVFFALVGRLMLVKLSTPSILYPCFIHRKKTIFIDSNYQLI